MTELEITEQLLIREISRRDVLEFTKHTFPLFQPTWFHKNYYYILNKFAHGEIKKLIVSMGPQHGKSEGSSRRLPAFLLGLNPNNKIAITSYSASLARKFNRAVQRIIDSREYANLFPNTRLNNSKIYGERDETAVRNTDEFEILGHSGGLKAVGRGGQLTGDAIDTLIMDDLYKDFSEANSPNTREAVIDWYTTVAASRLHNNCQQLIVFTRWHEGDLIGHIEEKEEVVVIDSFSQLDNINPDVWYKINFESIKMSEKTEMDPREEGEALWPERHSIKRLQSMRNLDVEKFDSLYQGNPKPKKGLLYGDGFNTYMVPPSYKSRFNYTDVADKGKDYLCSINYAIGVDDHIYILDVLYTQEPQEETEPEVSDMLINDKIRISYLESNNGGRGFGRTIKRLTKGKIIIEDFFQGKNKESRIITNAPDVKRLVHFPYNWIDRWPKFSKDLLNFKKIFKANVHDDSADAITGVVEYSGLVENNDYDSLYKL